MAEIDAAPESPPIPPTDNGDRLDREPLRLVEGESTEGVAPPPNPQSREGEMGTVSPKESQQNKK